jgi:hypothetical protein
MINAAAAAEAAIQIVDAETRPPTARGSAAPFASAARAAGPFFSTPARLAGGLRGVRVTVLLSWTTASEQ